MLKTILLSLSAAFLIVGFEIKHVDYNKEGYTEGFRQILAEDGLLALTNVPGLAQAREDALSQAAQCVLLNGGGIAPVSVNLKDQSERSTWAAFSDDSVAATSKCPGLQSAMEHLRGLVDLGTKRFISLLDDNVVAPSGYPLMTRKGSSETYNTFHSLLNNAQHLDHFHVYSKEHSSSLVPSLEMHTDHGLFICVVPSIRVYKNGLVEYQEDSFMIETPNGDSSVARLPNDGNVLLFMMGDGANHLSRKARYPLRPVPHALVLSGEKPSSARAWMGRMFFAPKDALLSNQLDTFQTVVETVVRAQEKKTEFPSLGCSTPQDEPQKLRWLMDTGATNCSSGTAYCWMGCVWKGIDLTCANPKCLKKDGTVLPDGMFDGDARLSCSKSSSAVISAPNFGTFGLVLLLLIAVVV